MKLTNRSPCGALSHETRGKVGNPAFGPAWFGVSSTLSVPAQPVPSSPQMCSRLSQCPISWVAVLPSAKGGVAVPSVPKAA
jgi:hypothetical protein